MLADCKTLDEYISRYQVDGVLWKAQKLLGSLSQTDIRRNDNVETIARTISLIPHDVRRDDYAKLIAKEHNLVLKTLLKLIDNHLVINRKKEDSKKIVRKNKIQTLEGDVNTFPFFIEQIAVNKKTNDETFKGIKIDKYKFVQLLAHFGFTRYETGIDDNKDGYTFVRLKDNVISSVTRDQIIDHIENFVKHDYDFARAECEYTDPELLINTFYDQIRTVFSKDLFARVRTDQPIIVNMDKKDTCYLYFENGFVQITKDGWDLISYSEMDGSVWEHQMLNRKFEPIPPTGDLSDYGVFADFCFKIAGQDEGRFKALCTIIGYLIHDFYEYKLKAVLFTDSSLTETSEGRTGKTLLGKLIGKVRSYCEINGKDFDASNKNKYEDVKLGTQVIHLNDVKNKGRNRFDFEEVFNDVTEGFIVNAKYMTPFRQFSKMIISTNKTLNIQGASQRDRIIEFEMSDFFGEHRSPADYYEHWFIRDWDDKEFNRFDNFMCFCAHLFFLNGLLEPAAINLGERKLMNHTATEFLEYMDEIAKQLRTIGVPWQGYAGPQPASFATCGIQEFQFDKKKLYEQFLHEYTDFKSWLTQRQFHSWIKQFCEIRLSVKKPKEWKSNGVSYVQFIPDDQK